MMIQTKKFFPLRFHYHIFVVLTIVVVLIAWINDVKKHEGRLSSNNDAIVLRDPMTITEYHDRFMTENITSIVEENDIDDDDDDENLAVMVTFTDILNLMLFLVATWLMSNVSVMIGLPGLVGEIVTGFLLGPPLANFCPFPEAMVLIGNFGLLGLMVESGIHVDIPQLRETGTRAVVLAAVGTVVALGAGIGLGYILDDSNFATSMAVGAAFAPSSLGVAGSVLSAGQVLNTPIGQLIVASSVIDDVLGLINLGLLNVFVMDQPKAFDFVQPFLASFGFLIALGYLGVTWIPHVVEKILLPKVPEQHREKATLTITFGLMLIYLPMLNSAGASYLTGAFLAGLSVSQLPSIHSSYERNGREIMVWLMRIFFSATIGFQVPILRYDDLNVLKWSVKFLIPIIAKLPLGLLVPRLQTDIPNDFPFDPYVRDVLITSLSLVCRGEFNFVVASFGLSSGLLDADAYSAVVLAVLVSSVVGPLALSQVIRYYNRLAQQYLSEPHPITRIGKTGNDGYRPLFIAIQIRTPTYWALHERFQHALHDLDVLILDHRTWHTNGLEAVEMSEIFAQDNTTRIRIEGCFRSSSERTATVKSSEEGEEGAEIETGDDEETGRNTSGNAASIRLDATARTIITTERGSLVVDESRIQQRLDEVKRAIESCLDSVDEDKYTIQANQWEPFVREVGQGHRLRRTYTFQDTLDPSDASNNNDNNFEAQQSIHLKNESLSAPTAELEEGISSSSSSSSEGVTIHEEGNLSSSTTNNNVSMPSSPRSLPTSPRPVTPRPSLYRRHSTRGGDSFDDHVICDLWETDEVAHGCVRRGSCSFVPAVAGHIIDDHAEETFLQSYQNRPRFYSTPSDVDPEGGDHREMGDEEMETSVIQHRLHGYVRH